MARHVILSMLVRVQLSKKLGMWLKRKPSQEGFALLSLMSKVYVLKYRSRLYFSAISKEVLNLRLLF